MCPNAPFCHQYMSNEFFYRPCNFHFNILSSFEIIAKTLSVALEVSLSIFEYKSILILPMPVVPSIKIPCP